MTAAVEWAAERLYHSPKIFPFQVKGVAQGYLLGQGIAAYDTGLGKSHIAMMLAALGFEDGTVTRLLLVAESNKLREWREDFLRFTRLKPVLYHGPGRDKRLIKADAKGEADVIISTYETIRQDAASFVKGPGRGTSIQDGKLMPYLRGKRMMVIYDEMTKLSASRSSRNYKAHQYMLKELRKGDADLRVFGLTATPMERDWESVFNQLRLVKPSAMPTVAGFEELMVRSRHPKYGTAKWRDENIPRFVEMCQPLILRKRKTDTDVIEEFPAKVEEARHVEMGKAQRELYEFLEDLAWSDDGELIEVPGLFPLLRQVAGHPAAVIRAAKGNSRLARMLVDKLGEDHFRSIGSAKSAALVEYLRPLVLGQGAKAMVFTFFGQSVLPEVAADLRDAGIPVYVHHGGMTQAAKDQAKADFRSSPQPAVLLSSDSGARGINVPEATYVVEFESAPSHALRDQRMNRSHRIDSAAPCVHCMTFVLDGTVEERIVATMLSRNAAQDHLLGDDADAGEHFTSAEDRRMMFSMARSRRR